MKIEKKKYIAPVSSFVEIEPLSMLAFSTNDERVETGEGDEGGDEGGWAKEEIGGSWEDIWNAQ